LKDIRQTAKAVNFGLLYGGSYLVLQRVAKYTYGVELSEDESKNIDPAYGGPEYETLGNGAQI
jgi:DNA polymerase I-like protein with 3'-5' exonuclease and polymerase domains